MKYQRKLIVGTPLNTLRTGVTSNKAHAYGRVVDVILDPSHPNYESLGRSQSISGIFYRELTKSKIEDTSLELKFAYQGDPYFRTTPVKGEIVEIYNAPSEERTTNPATTKTYWKSITAIWNHPNHNAYPDIKQTSGPTLDFGEDFKESVEVNPLLPFPGDVIIEGRHGHSVRFGGSSSKNNKFSQKTNNGCPYILIRNGKIIGKNSFDSIVEDINKDSNSLYLLSEHRHDLIPAQIKHKSLKKTPISVSTYLGSQAVLVSGRVVINSSTDDLILLSRKITAISGKAVGIDGEEYIGLDADKIYLGEKAKLYEREPVLLGDTTKRWLESLLDQLEKIVDTLSELPAEPKLAIATLKTRGTAIKPVLLEIRKNIRKLSSVKVYTE